MAIYGLSRSGNTFMKLADYRLGIPEAQELEDGYAVLQHGTQYTLLLVNDSDRRCDVKVTIDGNSVGIWRVNAQEEIHIERPAEDTGRFTFLKHGTAEGDAADLVKSEELGLISAEFRPERRMAPSLNAAPLGDYDAGGTGLSGKSEQRFDNVRALDFDPHEVTTIHIRLVSRRIEVRPLVPRSTPVPPPVA